MRKRARPDAEIIFEEEATPPRGKLIPRDADVEHANAPLVSSNNNAHKHHRTTPARIKLMAVLVGITFIVGVAIIHIKIPSTSQATVHFSCPSEIPKSANDITSENDEYERVTKLIQNNLTHYMHTYPNSTFDAWGRTYERVKQGMHHWKSTRVAPYLNNGDSIYESACGIGMNLRMTLEILHETKGIDSLQIYGNEYVPTSAQVANRIWDEHALYKSKKGTICAADSANLDFVPSNSFDLVYTGYITPINDPLHLHKGDMNENLKFYKGLCQGKDRQSIQLSKMAQRAQEDFYGQWVGEMVRIAKPDTPVIVEQVSMPYCEEEYDWGGVAREWWKPAIARYGWDIDPSSIEMEKDTIFHNRYHVFMRKNPA